MSTLFAIFIVFFGFSCGSNKKPEDVRTSPKRAITINNKTESDVIYFRVSVATSGVLIFEDEYIIKENSSIPYVIDPAYKEDPELEVVLIDCYNKVYAKKFKVPLVGNTDATITTNDRKSEGWFKDKWKDLESKLSGKCVNIQKKP